MPTAHGSVSESQPVEVDSAAQGVRSREYVNCAVYVETTNFQMSCQPSMYIPGSGDHTKTVKHCSCFANPGECPCHPAVGQGDDEAHDEVAECHVALSVAPAMETNVKSCGADSVDPPPQPPAEDVKLLQYDADAFESDSGITVKATSSLSDLRISIPTSVTSMSTMRQDNNFQRWCQRKDEERRLRLERDALIEKIKQQQRQAVLELERENFRKWLMVKKKLEVEAHERKLAEEAREKARQDEKERRIQESQLKYKLWLKQKEEKELEKKLERQLTMIREEEDKQKRIEYNRQAYEVWKAMAKNRQKPVPFGLGIDSLKSSASVTYINPQPWVPNIDLAQRSCSQ